ncbi:MAG: peptidase M61 [Gammaproteobacteria bacterium]|nr:MAG: peptidase M61 [Gammaproteobacteria bacterium]
MSIHYDVRITDPDAHLIDVTLTIDSPAPEGQRLTLPSWIPGSYMIRDFSRNIVSMAAVGDGRPVTLEKLGKSSWQAPAGLDSLEVSMRVYAWDRSVRSAHVDRSHAFFNGTSTFLAVVGQEDMPVTVDLHRPDGFDADTWRVATMLDVVKVDNAGFGRRRAASHDELIDHPVEMGDFATIDFEAGGVPHRMVVSGDVSFAAERLSQDLARICEWEIDFFGRPAPVDGYLFMTTIVGEGYGGLEHRNSTALLAMPENLPAAGTTVHDDKNDHYIRFLGLCSHEYFHTWNIKRIKPACFIPFRLDREVHTSLLWFFEGMTSYYDDIALVRSGLISHAQYLDLLAKTLTRVQRGPGRLTQSVAESSFDAWTKFYKQDENAPNAIVSYYARGALIGLCLDARIREATQGERSLDDIMRVLWQRWLDSGGEGVGEREPEAVAAEIAGIDLDDFFARHLHGTEELPLVEALASLGVSLRWVPRGGDGDRGMFRPGGAADGDDRAASQPTQDENRPPVIWFGATTAASPRGLLVQQVINGSPAEAAGLAGGDTLVAIGRRAVNGGNLSLLLERERHAGSVPLHYFRDGMIMESCLPIRTAPADTARLAITDATLLERWLGGAAAGS